MITLRCIWMPSKATTEFFAPKAAFFEHYIHQQGEDWVDANPETNKLVKTIRRYESKGNTVKHIIICREGWLYDKENGDTGPIDGDPRILHQRDVDDTRKVFKGCPCPWAAETRQLQADTNGGSSSRFSRRS